MRSMALVLVGISLCATNAFAGKIFGDISTGGKPVAAGVKVIVSLAGDTPAVDTTATDKFGSYKLFVKGEGKATLKVLYSGKALELPVFSNKEATRYDLVVEKKDDKLTLRRK
jgi:hypothetical protein